MISYKRLYAINLLSVELALESVCQVAGTVESSNSTNQTCSIQGMMKVHNIGNSKRNGANIRNIFFKQKLITET